MNTRSSRIIGLPIPKNIDGDAENVPLQHQILRIALNQRSDTRES